MAERPWQRTATKAGWRACLTSLVVVFGGAAAVAQNQISTGINKGQNEYHIAGMKAFAPNEYQAKAMLVSMMGGGGLFALGILSMVAGQIPLPDRKHKEGPKP